MIAKIKSIDRCERRSNKEFRRRTAAKSNIFESSKDPLYRWWSMYSVQELLFISPRWQPVRHQVSKGNRRRRTFEPGMLSRLFCEALSIHNTWCIFVSLPVESWPLPLLSKLQYDKGELQKWSDDERRKESDLLERALGGRRRDGVAARQTSGFFR